MSNPFAMKFPDDCHDDIFREFAIACRREREASKETVPEPIITSYDDKDFTKKPVMPIPNIKMKIDVMNIDTVTCIVQLIEYFKIDPKVICALNMANPDLPGAGMVSRHFCTQEEDILRRCDLEPHLPLKIYPLKVEQQVLSQGVKIKRDANYNYIKDDKEYVTSFITSCALIRPKKNNERFVRDIDRDITYNKIDQIFRTCYHYGYKVIILGPFGLGAFESAKLDTLDIFNELLKKYNNCFEWVIFAIIDNDNMGNWKLFNEGIKRN